MLISSKGRYALLIMLELAAHRGSDLPVRQIAENLELSEKYLARIMAALTQDGLIAGTHGKGGGYRLTRTPAEYTVGQIVRAADGSLSSIGDAQLSPRELASGTGAIWRQMDERIAQYLDAVTLASLCPVDAADEYVI